MRWNKISSGPLVSHCNHVNYSVVAYQNETWFFLCHPLCNERGFQHLSRHFVVTRCDCGTLSCNTLHSVGAGFRQTFQNSICCSDLWQTPDFVNLRSTMKFAKTWDHNVTIFFRM